MGSTARACLVCLFFLLVCTSAVGPSRKKFHVILRHTRRPQQHLWRHISKTAKPIWMKVVPFDSPYNMLTKVCPQPSSPDQRKKSYTLWNSPWREKWILPKFFAHFTCEGPKFRLRVILSLFLVASILVHMQSFRKIEWAVFEIVVRASNISCNPVTGFSPAKGTLPFRGNLWRNQIPAHLGWGEAWQRPMLKGCVGWAAVVTYWEAVVKCYI